MPTEGELRIISEISNGNFSHTIFLQQAVKISGLDFSVAMKIVFISSRKGRKIKGYRFNGNLYDLFIR